MTETHLTQRRAAGPSAISTPLRIGQSDLPGPPEAHQFVGADHGGLPISLFLVDGRPGAGPLLHRHPYPELFIVHAGRADFEIDAARLTATAGDILIAPATSAHRFTNTGDERLRITAIHTAPVMETEWLQAARRTEGAPR
ncbi:MAG TPA: cupin domain-containing protein [Solirubrobacteraceae bacterium]|jgi:quercetin dioxygenase-like cupin family protein